MYPGIFHPLGHRGENNEGVGTSLGNARCEMLFVLHHCFVCQYLILILVEYGFFNFECPNLII